MFVQSDVNFPMDIQLALIEAEHPVVLPLENKQTKKNLCSFGLQIRRFMCHCLATLFSEAAFWFLAPSPADPHNQTLQWPIFSGWLHWLAENEWSSQRNAAGQWIWQDTRPLGVGVVFQDRGWECGHKRWVGWGGSYLFDLRLFDFLQSNSDPLCLQFGSLLLLDRHTGEWLLQASFTQLKTITYM